DVRAARIAIVTSEVGMHADTDLRLIVEALRAGGSTAEPVAWDAESVAWDRFDLAVIRSTWDYAERVGEFLAWADATARLTHLWNPAPVLRWNSDKRYLPDLAEQGVAVVPTRFIEPGGRFGEEDFQGDGGVVVKPAVSAGATDTARYEPGRHADAMRHARMLLDHGRVVMVQPYLRLVEEGERALVFFSGTFSHAIRKGPVLTEPGVIDNFRMPHPDVATYRPTDEEIDTALAALAAVPSPESPLFARVDLALDESRKPVVMELELIEPNLFLGDHPRGLERFVDAVWLQQMYRAG
ncbi:RimK family alpha-L-glutamate ligase, partial [Streptomyces sp. NPDC019890]|uniref:ATP-grasp domain-containing protein n=1 Tax=Streptomyces sp. NPDC019890 TaxID=3365064 RepID=UPI00384EFD56